MAPKVPCGVKNALKRVLRGFQPPRGGWVRPPLGGWSSGIRARSGQPHCPHRRGVDSPLKGDRGCPLLPGLYPTPWATPPDHTSRVWTAPHSGVRGLPTGWDTHHYYLNFPTQNAACGARVAAWRSWGGGRRKPTFKNGPPGGAMIRSKRRKKNTVKNQWLTRVTTRKALRVPYRTWCGWSA